jgi:hypothetical protein
LYYSEKGDTPFRKGFPVVYVKVRQKDPLEDQVPEYGLEALVSTIEDREELIKAIKDSKV